MGLSVGEGVARSASAPCVSQTISPVCRNTGLVLMCRSEVTGVVGICDQESLQMRDEAAA